MLATTIFSFEHDNFVSLVGKGRKCELFQSDVETFLINFNVNESVAKVLTSFDLLFGEF